MGIANYSRNATRCALGALVLLGLVCAPARAQAPAGDPAAVQTLKRMTDYLDGLKQFSVHTQNTIEDLLDSGQRVDYAVSVSLVVSRPNQLRAERRGDLMDQACPANTWSPTRAPSPF